MNYMRLIGVITLFFGLAVGTINAMLSPEEQNAIALYEHIQHQDLDKVRESIADHQRLSVSLYNLKAKIHGEEQLLEEKSILEAAFKQKNPEIVRLLLEAGANPNEMFVKNNLNGEGMNKEAAIFIIAKQTSLAADDKEFQACLTVLSLLFEHGADPTSRLYFPEDREVHDKTLLEVIDLELQKNKAKIQNSDQFTEQGIAEIKNEIRPLSIL